MLTSVTIEGFKSIADEVTVELGRVNVFIGANASGKSAVLEAIGVLGAAAGGRVDDPALSRRGVRPGVPSLYMSAFRSEQPRTVISLRGDWKSGRHTAGYHVDLTNPIDDSERAWKYAAENVCRDDRALEKYSRSRARKLPVDAYTGLAARGIGEVDFKGVPEQLIRALSHYAIFSPTTAVLRGVQSDQQQQDPVGVSGGRLAEAYRETLRYCREENRLDDIKSFRQLLDWVEGTGVSSVPPTRQVLSPSVPAPSLTIRFTDRFMAKGRNRVMAYDASEGALYVLFLGVLALHPKSPRVLAIDNFDQAMHPRLARAAARVLCDNLERAEPARQVLLTTHNPLVLDGLDLRNDSIRLFAVERAESGTTRVNRVMVSPKLIEEAERGMTLSRLWVMGRLGAVPNV